LAYAFYYISILAHQQINTFSNFQIIKSSNQHIAYLISVTGLVQGVGFRPFVYRLARKYNLNGWVVNRTDGLSIQIEGPSSVIPSFIEDLKNLAPVVSQVEEIKVVKAKYEGSKDFVILASQDNSDETSEISPDIAVCPECLADMKMQPNRINYPFINCTHCGPRFTIIKDFPYDRKKTTMASFIMCDECREEYENIMDRRFHAQPVACNQCGPVYTFHTQDNVIHDLMEILEHVCSVIKKGGILAVKGTGGFHLMCDAQNEDAVSRLRKSKKREGKPFAVMFRDIESVKEFLPVSEAEEKTLVSWRRPIVILNAAKQPAYSISSGLNTVGVFLPYMPWHYLFFEKSGLPAIVLTSGNLAGEPIIIDNMKALELMPGVVDGVLTYNRDIYNRTDDSVVRIMHSRERVFRRSRGFVPAAVRVHPDVTGILATGAELSNSFCLGKGNRAYLSQYIGDLKNQETMDFFEETVALFLKLFRTQPELVAADLHPDYLSTRYARSLGIELIQVQHHHAHIASSMAENRLNEPVIGLAFDGTGYGDDGNTWGSEFLVCDYKGYTRRNHFAYMPMPGGDRAAEEPWRMGLSLLYQSFGDQLFDLDIPLIQSIDLKKAKLITDAISKNINAPLSSGAGRLFDAVASITGICNNSIFHAEAPMKLESAIRSDIRDFYDVNTSNGISFLPAIQQICADLSQGVSTGIISARFHNTVVEASFQEVRKISRETGINKIVLSGGTFQNKYVFESLETKLRKNNFVTFSHEKIPCNDGGLSLGQLVVAAAKRL
jgi:hydrogenase maturation protein HypF